VHLDQLVVAVNEYLINSIVVEVTAESTIVVRIDVSKNIKVAQLSALARRKGGVEVGIPCGFSGSSRETNETETTNSNRIGVATVHIEGIG
jgi:hypothetical protein